MFREMRRKRQLLSESDTIDILNRGTSGVLALLGDEGYPYAVPLSYVYHEGNIYFHGAKSGHKLDAMIREPKASFCVIDQDQVISEEYTTYFRSVVAFGTMRVLTDETEIDRAIDILAQKYYPTDTLEGRRQAIDREKAALNMFVLEIESMTGKEAIELVRLKKNS